MANSGKFFADNIRALRKKLKMTQFEVAEKIDISPRVYQKYEQGESLPRIKTAEKLASLFNCTVADLYNESGTNKETLVSDGIEQMKKLLTSFQLAETNISLPGPLGEIVNLLSDLNESELRLVHGTVSSLVRTIKAHGSKKAKNISQRK